MASSLPPSSPDFSPVGLDYAAALRGRPPRATGAPFTYVACSVVDVDFLTALAASNPEGQFWGLVEDPDLAARAIAYAGSRGTPNVTFLESSPTSWSEFETRLGTQADYLVCSERTTALTPEERDTLFDLAATILKPTGLFSYRYAVAPNGPALARFIVSELAPNMTPEQSGAFLEEIETLGAAFFPREPELYAALAEAIATQNPEIFFNVCLRGGEPTVPEDTNVRLGLTQRNFAPLGSAEIRANYLELSTPSEAHESLLACREHPLYESLKSLASARLARSDVWCHLPATASSNNAELFGSFVFGASLPPDSLPEVLESDGGFRLTRTDPLIANLLALMSSLPAGIGDFLAHPLGQKTNPQDVAAAVQMLVACGALCPMRARCTPPSMDLLRSAVWSVAYNKGWDEIDITRPAVAFASPVVGRPVTLPARHALVLQALLRKGYDNLVESLFHELQRITHLPALRASLSEVPEFTPELTLSIAQEVLRSEFVRWCAFGLVAATAESREEDDAPSLRVADA